MIKHFDWRFIWYKLRFVPSILLGMALGWLLFGCAIFPGAEEITTEEPKSKSQSLIDQEVERINAWNEALRKLNAQGCNTANLLLVDPYVDSEGNSYYEYECKTNSGVWIKLRKFNNRWVIHGSRERLRREIK